MTRTAVRLAVLLFAAAATVRAEDAPQPDDAARRAVIAKLGRLAWGAPTKSVAFCDLDGANVVETASRQPDWLRWLPDGRRVVAVGQDRVFVVDSTTGAVTDLTADAKYGERFLAHSPVLSPDGRRLVTWRSVMRDSRSGLRGANTVASEIVGYALYDLDTGTRKEIGPAHPPHDTRDAVPAAWSRDGLSLYVALGVDTPTLTRLRFDGRDPRAMATVSPGCRIAAVAVDGPQPVFAVQGGRGFEVRGADGRTFLSLPRPVPCLHPLQCLDLAWEDRAATLLVRTMSDEEQGAPVRRRIGPTSAPEKLADAYLPRRAAPRGATWAVEERRLPNGRSSLFRVTAATGESVLIVDGVWPRAFGDIVLFWRPTTETDPRRYYDLLHWLPGPCELSAYDPRDGSTIRLGERKFETRAWDITLRPPASRTR